MLTDGQGRAAMVANLSAQPKEAVAMGARLLRPKVEAM
ncbi:MAG: hypothetical protein AVDCRST_MAG19-194 [uncultured Thermomicrobiales bacterium]|uniref:Uncharacterized protein n=1 Tax=uncultured Thermomicrobiales bacterium TaxID=1645740 RepID=A0A6J4UEN2_9BACT|nr:MAG: hypothetical protein AVDCRST_MAG19-194 [uncultured Thermomicrobiales bacterium]